MSGLDGGTGSNLLDTTAAAAASTTKAVAPGAATAVFGWVTSNQGIAVIGLLLTIAGFVINLIFQIRRDRRAVALQREQIATLRASRHETREAEQNLIASSD